MAAIQHPPMTDEEREWREDVQEHAMGCTAQSISWLMRGCPLCGCKSWQVTRDHWAYCDGCKVGVPTRESLTHLWVAHLDETGVHPYPDPPEAIQEVTPEIK